MKAWRKHGKRCTAFTVEKKGRSHLHVQCGKKVYKQWLCAEHYDMAVELAEYRARFNYVNPARRIKHFLQREGRFGGRQWKKLKKHRQRLSRQLTKAAEQAAIVEATYG